MNEFVIQETLFQISAEYKDEFIVDSFPKPYTVKFTDFKNIKFNDDDILLVDRIVAKLYNINHKNILLVDALEEVKVMETVLDLCKVLTLKYNFTKANTLHVIGGGITQDIGATVAKLFKRGITWKFYPTTLLAQADSCIGGKCALNFMDRKNQLALFSDPDEVIIDVNFLDTLPNRDMISGYGEIIKMYLIGGQHYIDNYENFNMKELIFHSLMIKKAIIEKDQFEKDERKALNYGHSFGHVIEPLSNYSISHGEAVLLGMDIVNQIFHKYPNYDTTKCINKFTNLSKIKNLDVDKLVDGLFSDKKTWGNFITFVLIPTPGLTLFQNHYIDNILKRKVYDILTN